MNINKIILGFMGVVAIGLGAYFVLDGAGGPKKEAYQDSPEIIAADYEVLLAESEELQVSTGSVCDNKKDINQKIEEMESQLADLAERKKTWLDHASQLPEVTEEVGDVESPSGPPGSEVPELLDYYPNNDPRPGSQVPELLDYYPNTDPRPGSQVPELLDYYPNTDPRPGSQVPELLDYYPNTDPRPGSQVPELTSDNPPLPDIDEVSIVAPNEDITRMEESEQKIKNILNALKALCKEEAVVKVVSDKCSDSCQRYKTCASFGGEATPADLNDAYDTCMEECATWPKEMVKCINSISINTPNDCISFLNCELPQFYEDNYLN